MKVIHCSDIHLDSKLDRLGTTEKKKERKAELLKAFTNMVEDGAAMGVSAIIIAGDLFDQSRVLANTQRTVLGTIESNPDIDFYYLKGNHDRSDFLAGVNGIPENLHMFNHSWTSYDLGENITLTGVELNRESRGSIYQALTLDATRFNIVTLHGQEVEAAGDRAEVINLKGLRNKGIDYLALGHVHSFKLEDLDNRGRYCYPGCLEARGFDETGEHGYVVLNINGVERSCEPFFISKPIRRAWELEVDVTGLENSIDISTRVKNELLKASYHSGDMVKVTLIGDVSADCDKNIDYIRKQLEDCYFDYKVKDRTRIKIDYDEYKLDESLKGEFVRMVWADDTLTDEEKAEIIKIGIGALRGEEIE